jgi:hypothetical protein
MCLPQRTSDVYAALLQREIPSRDAEFNCGRSFLAADRADLGEEIFRRLVECGYNVCDSRYQLCECLFAQSMFVEAKSELRKLLQDDPEHEEGILFAASFQQHVNRGTRNRGSAQPSGAAADAGDHSQRCCIRGTQQAVHCRSNMRTPMFRVLIECLPCLRCACRCCRRRRRVEGKIFIYGLLGIGALIGLVLGYQRSKRGAQ